MIAGPGGVHFQGLKYEAVEKAFDLKAPADMEDAWWAVRVIEAEAVSVRNEDAN